MRYPNLRRGFCGFASKEPALSDRIGDLTDRIVSGRTAVFYKWGESRENFLMPILVKI